MQYPTDITYYTISRLVYAREIQQGRYIATTQLSQIGRSVQQREYLRSATILSVAVNDAGRMPALPALTD